MMTSVIVSLLLGVYIQGQIDTPVFEDLCATAERFELQGDYRQALHYYTNAKKRNPNDVRALKGYLECTRRVSPVELISMLKDYIVWRQKEPLNVTVQYALAKTYDEIYKWKESTYPTRDKGIVPEELMDEANIYRREFEKEMQQTVRMDPTLVYPYYDLIDEVEEFAEHEEALELMRKILKLTPDDLNANMKMASLCFSHMAVNPRTVRPDVMNMTIKYSQKVLALNPGNKDALYYLACAYQQGGHYEKAIEVFKKRIALEKNSDSGGAKMCRFWIDQMEKETRKGTRRKLIPLSE